MRIERPFGGREPTICLHARGGSDALAPIALAEQTTLVALPKAKCGLAVLPVELWQQILSHLELPAAQEHSLGDLGRFRRAAPRLAAVAWSAKPEARQRLVRTLSRRYIIGSPSCARQSFWATLALHAGALDALLLNDICVGQKQHKLARLAEVMSVGAQARTVDCSGMALTGLSFVQLPLPQVGTIEQLFAGRNLLGDHHIVHWPFARAARLRVLDLSGCRLRADAAATLPLDSLPLLESLNLSFNRLGDEGVASLALGQATCLLSLRLCANALTARGVSQLAWGQLKLIEHVDLRSNAIAVADWPPPQRPPFAQVLFGSLLSDAQQRAALEEEQDDGYLPSWEPVSRRTEADQQIG